MWPTFAAAMASSTTGWAPAVLSLAKALEGGGGSVTDGESLRPSNAAHQPVGYHFVMTKSAHADGSGGSPPVAHCRWCRRTLAPRRGPGRPRVFCSQRCRQWDWVARQRARELQLNENELVVAREELDALHDELYVLACAVEDVERDLDTARQPTASDLRDAVEWLLAAAKPLRDREISPSS